jgi:hypothetical protein
MIANPKVESARMTVMARWTVKKNFFWSKLVVPISVGWGSENAIKILISDKELKDNN